MTIEIPRDTQHNHDPNANAAQIVEEPAGWRQVSMAANLRPSRSWVRYSLRTGFVVLTIGLVVLGIVSDRVRKQRNLIEVLGGRAQAQRVILFDFQEHEVTRSGAPRPSPRSPSDRLPRSLVNLVGEDWFETVVAIDLSLHAPSTDEKLVDAICAVKTIRYIRFGPSRVSESQYERIRQALPGARVLDARVILRPVEKSEAASHPQGSLQFAS